MKPTPTGRRTTHAVRPASNRHPPARPPRAGGPQWLAARVRDGAARLSGAAGRAGPGGLGGHPDRAGGVGRQLHAAAAGRGDGVLPGRGRLPCGREPDRDPAALAAGWSLDGPAGRGGRRGGRHRGRRGRPLVHRPDVEQRPVLAIRAGGERVQRAADDRPLRAPAAGRARPAPRAARPVALPGGVRQPPPAGGLRGASRGGPQRRDPAGLGRHRADQEPRLRRAAVRQRLPGGAGPGDHQRARGRRRRQARGGDQAGNHGGGRRRLLRPRPRPRPAVGAGAAAATVDPGRCGPPRPGGGRDRLPGGRQPAGGRGEGGAAEPSAGAGHLLEAAGDPA